jgi:N-alpha-acetyltransferase 30
LSITSASFFFVRNKRAASKRKENKLLHIACDFVCFGGIVVRRLLSGLLFYNIFFDSSSCSSTAKESQFLYYYYLNAIMTDTATVTTATPSASKDDALVSASFSSPFSGGSSSSINNNNNSNIIFVDYQNESQIDNVMRLVALDLSEPYSIFTYRYFLHRFPDLCILAVDAASTTTTRRGDDVCGCVVGKIDIENNNNNNSAVEQVMVQDDDVVIVGDSSRPPLSQVEQMPHMDNHNAAAAVVQQQQQQRPQTTGYIGMLAVSKSHRRKGIGKALVKQVLQRMKDKGCTSVTLETEVSNVTAQQLYQNFGFVREELLVRYYLNNGDAYRLRLWF